MTEILLYGIIGDSWDGLDANTIVPMISAGDDDLEIRINSPGGYVMEGLAIYNAIERAKSQGRKVTTHCDGLAASMASVILMAGDDRLMADNALLMIHNPMDGAFGDAAELRRTADKLDIIRDQLVKVYSQKTGIDAVALVAMLDEETWLTPEQCLEQNFVTEIVGALTAAACDISAFGFHKAPDSPHLVTSAAAVIQSIVTGGAMTGISSAVAAILHPRKDKTMPQGNQPAVETTPPIITPAPVVTEPVALTQADVDKAAAAAAAAAVAADRTRSTEIRALTTKHNLGSAFADELINDGAINLATAREKILDKLAERSDSEQIGHNGAIIVGKDSRDKFMEGAANWILVRAGVAQMVENAAKLRGETLRIDPGEFRGASMASLAGESLQIMGQRVTSRDPRVIIGDAFTAVNAITQGTGDFPLLLENALHKIVLASYATTPDKWTKFCGKTSVSDFKANNMYRLGTFGVLDSLNELGEFKQKAIPDGAREKLTASTKGNIIALSRQALINDDMGAFNGFAVDLGRAAKLTIEVDVFAYINSNPNTGDGQPFFSAAHGNLMAAGAAPTVAEIDLVRQKMASQKDISGNDFLEISPSIWLGPLALGGQARVSNGSQFDPDTANKLQRMNIALGIFDEIVDTARLTGTPWYTFADPTVAPAIVVGFLNGVEEPFIDNEIGWRVDGTEVKVRIDYGIAGINPASAVKDPGQ